MLRISTMTLLGTYVLITPAITLAHESDYDLLVQEDDAFMECALDYDLCYYVATWPSGTPVQDAKIDCRSSTPKELRLHAAHLRRIRVDDLRWVSMYKGALHTMCLAAANMCKTALRIRTKEIKQTARAIQLLGRCAMRRTKWQKSMPPG